MREEKDVKSSQREAGGEYAGRVAGRSRRKSCLSIFGRRGPEAFDFGPDVDGYFLPEPVPAIFAAGKQNDVPLLAGWNHDEGSFEVAFNPQKPTAESMKADAQKEFGDKAAQFLKLYPTDTPEQALRSAQDFAGDKFIAFSTWAWLEAAAKTGKQPVYRYRFDLGPPSDPKGPQMGAYHSAEIEYVFGQLDSKAGVEVAAGDSRPQRPDAEVLGELRAQRRSQWSGVAEVAGVFGGGRMAGDVSGCDVGGAEG